MKNLIYVCLGIYCLSMIVNAWFSIPVADDFCNAIYAKTYGSIGYAIHLYKTWTGRFLTSLALSLPLAHIPINHINWISSFLVIIYLLFQYKFSSLISYKDRLVVFAVMGCLTWFTYRSVLGRIVVWYTGGMVYIISYILIPFFILEFLKCFKNKKLSITIIIFSILLANSLEVIPPAIIFFILGFSALSGDFLKKENLTFIFSLCAIITISSTPLFLAPGNFARAQTVTNSGLSMSTILDGYINVVQVYLDSSKNLLVPSILLGIVLSSMLEPEKSQERKLLGLSLIIAAIGSGLPMGFAKGFNGSRPASLFVLLSSLGCLSYFSSLKTKFNLERFKKSFAMTIILLTSIGITFDISRGTKIRSQFMDRHHYLTSLKNPEAEIDLTAFKSKAPRSLNCADISDDPKSWENYCFANYYQIKSVKVLSQQHTEVYP